MFRRPTLPTAETPQDAETADDNDDDEVKPWWAYVVEFIIIPIYYVFSRLWPEWVWDRRGVRDDEIANMDLDIYITFTVLDAMDELAYPLVRIPKDLKGFDRVIWRLRSHDWWTVKCWNTFLVVKRFFKYGPTMAPKLRLSPYNGYALSH